MTVLEMTSVLGDAPVQTGGQQCTIEGLFPQRLDVSCTPGSIEVGRTCGMSEMCGESPCLCGAQDAWQDCACNGLETLYPDVSVTTSAAEHVQVVNVGGAWQAVGLLPGEAQITVRATLKHYEPAEQFFHVQVAGPSPAGLAIILGVLVIIVGAAGTIVRAVRRKRSRKTGRESSLDQGSGA